MNRRLIVACAAAAGLTACQDVGLPDRNLAFEEAQHRPPSALVVAVHRDAADTTALMAGEETRAPVAGEGELGAERRTPVAVGGRTYIVSGRAQEVPEGMLRAVGSFRGKSLFALQWDEEPFDRLYTTGQRPNEYWELHFVPEIGPERHPKEGGGH